VVHEKKSWNKKHCCDFLPRAVVLCCSTCLLVSARWCVVLQLTRERVVLIENEVHHLAPTWRQAQNHGLTHEKMATSSLRQQTLPCWIPFSKGCGRRGLSSRKLGGIFWGDGSKYDDIGMWLEEEHRRKLHHDCLLALYKIRETIRKLTWLSVGAVHDPFWSIVTRGTCGQDPIHSELDEMMMFWWQSRRSSPPFQLSWNQLLQPVEMMRKNDSDCLPINQNGQQRFIRAIRQFVNPMLCGWCNVWIQPSW
jgi:hypothetical protein